ncbi:formin-F-like [Sitophilus oryzae]|uniref:Formin-F-like n=1 Tax=Sitophilus oryzae TaxID=7048 RepID=A0A6J2XDJ7_SITOR|nr:formin-F-like [Sitophilus oryzae]
MKIVFYFTVFLIPIMAEEVLQVTARDSYLDAYKESRADLNKSNKEIKVNRKSGVVFPVYPGPSGSGYEPEGVQYGPPAPQYGPPGPQYGPPGPQYGPPGPQYGPPGPQYGPPPSPPYSPPSPSYGGSFAEPAGYPPAPVYGSPQNLQVFYGVPHAMVSIWDKLWEKIKWKLDLFTLGKILLKLVIFKKIVSLIAILCLLLFIPSLKHKKLFPSGDHEERSSEKDPLNEITSFVTGAIDHYNNMNRKDLGPTKTYKQKTR